MRGQFSALWLAFLICLPAFAGSESQCKNNFGALAITQPPPKNGPAVIPPPAERPKTFDHDTYVRAKAFFEEKLSKREMPTAKDIRALGENRPEVTLAFMAASSKVAKTHPDFAFAVPDKQTLRDQFLKATGDLDVTKEQAWADWEGFLGRIYFSVHDPRVNYPSLPGAVSRRLPTPPKEFLRRPLQDAIWRRDFEGALKVLGFDHDPELYEQLRNWWATHPNIRQAVYGAGLDEFAYRVLGAPWYIPTYLPKFETTRAIHFSPELIERAARDGFDAVYPELWSKYRYYAGFDTFYQSARIAVYRAALVAIGYGVYAAIEGKPAFFDPRYWIFRHRYNSVTNAELNDQQNRTFNAENVRREQFQSFQREYQHEYERKRGPLPEVLPSPWEPDYVERCTHFPAEYKQEADDMWAFLSAMGPEDLKAAFPESAKRWEH